MRGFLPRLIRCAVAVILIGGATLACYENSVGGAFVFDDDHFIVENDNIKHLRFEDLGMLRKDVESIVAYNPFRAFLSITFALNFKYTEKKSLDEFSPFGFHVVNITVHFLASVLAFFVVRKIILLYRMSVGKGESGWAGAYFPALIAALLFTACPLHTEAVTYIVQRGESMCAMFMLAAMLCFLHARSHQIRRYERDNDWEDGKPERRSYAWVLAGLPLLVVVYKATAVLTTGPGGVQAGGVSPALLVTGVLALLYFTGIVLGAVIFPNRIQWRGDLLLLASYFFFGLAALTKELAAVLPLLLLLAEAVVFRAGRKGHMRRSLRYHAPFLVTLLLFFILRMLVVLPVGQGEASGWEGTELSNAYLAQQVSGSVIMDYLGKVFIPLELNLDPDMRLFDASRGDRLLSTAFVGLLLVILGALVLQKYARLPAFGIMWFFVALLPTSSVLGFADVMAEHRVYLASLGVFMAVGVALTEAVRLRKSQTMRIVALAIVTVFLAGVLVSNTVRVRRRNEQYWSAKVLWTDTLRKSPDKARPYNALGYLCMKEGAAVGILEDPGRLEEEVQERTRQLVLAKMFLTTAAIYDQKDLWELIRPESNLHAAALTADKRFEHLEANRICNNLGVVHSQEAEMLRIQHRYGVRPERDEAEMRRELRLNRLQALANYCLSLMLNPRGIQPLVNSSKIRSTIAIDYEAKAKSASRKKERDKYWSYSEKELAASESLVLRAMSINRFYRGAVNHMRELEFKMAAHYDPHFTNEGDKDRKDSKKALAHWHRLDWLSSIDPAVNKVAVRNAIERLELESSGD